MKFTYANPTQIIFGQQQIAAIASQITPQQKVLIVYGGGSIKKNGVYDQVVNALQDHQWVEFSGVEPNPTVETQDKAVALAREEKIDFILAVGGGSVIDGSKYIAAAIGYQGEGWDILVGKHIVDAAIPLGVILTLPATGSESNSGAVITRKSTNDKLPFMSPFVLPRFAVMDPDVMKSLPERQLINGLVDAFVHVSEQYITFPSGAMVQEGYAEVLLRNLLTLGNSFNERDDDAWRANLMWTANQALNGLIGSGVAQDWATHMIGHELTVLYGVDHARSLAIVQPSLLRNQLQVKQDKLVQMGINVFALKQADYKDQEALALETIAKIESFYQQLNVATHLSDAIDNIDGVVETTVAQLQKHGMVALGEHQKIDLATSTAILSAAL